MSYHGYRLAFLSGIYLLVMMFYATASIAMPYGFTLYSREACHLHMAYFYVCCGIAGVIFAVLIYSLIKCRQLKGVQAVHFHAHFWLEIFWTVVPFLILTALAMPAMIVLKHACG